MRDTLKNNWIGLVAIGLVLITNVKGCPAPSPVPPPEPVAPILLPKELTAQPGDIVKLSAETAGKIVRWDTPGLQRERLDDKTVILVAKTKGKYRVLAWTSLKTGWGANGEATEAAECTLIVGDVPPDPSPIPPVPPPDPSPTPGEGLRVLVVYESGELGKYPKEQSTIITSTKMREYLNSKCIKIGNTPEYRFFDKDAPLENESQIWRDVMTRPRQSLPWIIIGNGKDGFEGSLPKNVDETLILLKKFGG